MIKKWTVNETEKLATNRVFSIRKDTSTSPETGEKHDFFVIEPPDWVNVVAVTELGCVVLIKQYRHGTREVTVEIPGGMVDAGEEPLETAKRELSEETGYIAGEWRLIGEVSPNPAIQSNRCFTYLALGAEKAGKPDFDGTEFIETFVEPVDRVKELLEQRVINHALVVAALYWYFADSGL